MNVRICPACGARVPNNGGRGPADHWEATHRPHDGPGIPYFRSNFGEPCRPTIVEMSAGTAVKCDVHRHVLTWTPEGERYPLDWIPASITY